LEKEQAMSAIGSRDLLADERTLYAEIVRRIVAAADPEQIIVFGSRARGDHRPDSDFDILVVKETSEPRYMRSRALYGALADLPVEVDVSVYTPQEIAAWRGVRQAFTTTATREGKVIYERAA
ncbi:MAG TPA: nucleotidyltransferase domain-containing protein, partial [Thermomicrobiales bacterium]|nr:nucleotidyltransferase domain-containing protein [Thermomicrobiales bacterium]